MHVLLISMFRVEMHASNFFHGGAVRPDIWPDSSRLKWGMADCTLSVRWSDLLNLVLSEERWTQDPKATWMISQLCTLHTSRSSPVCSRNVETRARALTGKIILNGCRAIRQKQEQEERGRFLASITQSDIWWLYLPRPTQFRKVINNRSRRKDLCRAVRECLTRRPVLSITLRCLARIAGRGPPGPPPGSRMASEPPRPAAAPKFGHLIVKCVKGVELKVNAVLFNGSILSLLLPACRRSDQGRAKMFGGFAIRSLVELRPVVVVAPVKHHGGWRRCRESGSFQSGPCRDFWRGSTNGSRRIPHLQLNNRTLITVPAVYSNKLTASSGWIRDVWQGRPIL